MKINSVRCSSAPFFSSFCCCCCFGCIRVLLAPEAFRETARKREAEREIVRNLVRCERPCIRARAKSLRRTRQQAAYNISLVFICLRLGRSVHKELADIFLRQFQSFVFLPERRRSELVLLYLLDALAASTRYECRLRFRVASKRAITFRQNAPNAFRLRRVAKLYSHDSSVLG